MNPAIQRLVNKHLGRKTTASRPSRPERKKTSSKSIDESTPIIPIAMAEGVVAKAARLLDEDLQGPLAEQLVKTAEQIFQHNPSFRKKVMSASGRDYLWNFMQHWLTSDLMKSGRYDTHKLRRILIQGGFSLGHDVY